MRASSAYSFGGDSSFAYDGSSLSRRSRGGGVGVSFASPSAASLSLSSSFAEDEFAATFESHHDIAAAERRARDARSARLAAADTHMEDEDMNGTSVSAAALSVPSSRRHSGFSAPPTASLSSMIAASAHSRGATPARAFDSRAYEPSFAASATSSQLVPGGAASPLASRAQFASHLASAEQFRFRHWSRDIHTWRIAAAGVWYGVVALSVLHAFQMSLASVWPGLQPVSWLSNLVASAPLFSQPLVATWFVALQAALLWTRAAQATTDPSPLFQPVLTRVWRSLFDVASMTTLGVSVVTTALSGWCAMEVIFVRSALWNAGSAVVVEAGSVPTTVVSDHQVAFIVSGFLTYTLVQSCALVLQHQSLLTFPVVAHLSRSRLLMQAMPALFIDAAYFALKFTLIFTAAVWTIIGRTIVTIMSQADKEDGVAPSVGSTSIFPSLAGLYHLFLIVCCLALLANLSRRFVQIFLTQHLDFHHYFLHALYAQTSNDDAVASVTPAPRSNGLALQSNGGARAADASLNQLTQHLALHWLVDLAASPSLRARRNDLLFQDDMNRMFSSAAASSVEVAPRSTLPVQPAFVPVLSFALAEVRGLTDRLVAQRLLVSSPAVDEYDPSVGLAGATLSTAAFLATQIDGAGLFFPTRSQQTAVLFAQADQVNLCIQLASFLATHAMREIGADASQLDASSFSPVPTPYTAAAAQLAATWFESIISELLALGLAIDQYVHAPHFISPMQEQILQGHQITRSVCLHVASVLDSALFRLVATAASSSLSELRLSPTQAARLQAYRTGSK